MSGDGPCVPAASSAAWLLIDRYVGAAGYDTSTAAISWTLGLIAAHPAVQRKVAAELDSIGLKGSAERPQPRGLSWEDLSQLDYLRKVIKVPPCSDSRTIPLWASCIRR